MRKISKLAALDPAARQHIFNLCERHPYPTVVGILARPPAEGGFALATSVSALCRFATTYRESAEVEARSESLRALLSEQPHLAPGVILSHLQARLLADLVGGAPLRKIVPGLQLALAFQKQTIQQPIPQAAAEPVKAAPDPALSAQNPFLTADYPPQNPRHSASPSKSA